MTEILLWALPIAAAAHIFEEFVWPGGFKAWYARYRPETVKSFTPRFAIGINALLIVVSLAPAMQPAQPSSIALWLTVAAIVAGNAGFHLRAVFKMREYSPGVITGVALYVPIALVGYRHFVTTGRASVGTAVAAAILGGSYNWISVLSHRRRARRAAAGGTT